MPLVLDAKYTTPRTGRGWGVPWTIHCVERRRRAERRGNGTVASVCDVLEREPADRLAAGAGTMSGSAPSLGNVRLTKREQEIKELIEAGLRHKKNWEGGQHGANTPTADPRKTLSENTPALCPAR